MVAKLFLLQFYLFGCVIVRLRKMLFAVAGLRPQNILLVFLASLENLKFRYEIVLQPSLCVIMFVSIFLFFNLVFASNRHSTFSALQKSAKGLGFVFLFVMRSSSLL
ncbi:MAG: hypothetical protein AUJ36_00800 [Parcubacteria group bacterium CG1_02_41_26]|nr:MAG: hypothetical protein AUJ36_00800 [Parcubacteria group bacterium CG1_02_41_26]